MHFYVPVCLEKGMFIISIDIFTNRRLRFYLETILQNVHMPLRNLMQKFFLLVGGYFACNIHFSQVDSHCLEN